MAGKKIGLFSLLTVLILLFGGFLRIQHLFKIDFVHEPFRLGGLFVAFSEAILHGGFALPATIPYYSSGGIPFGYPPLGFYVEALFLQFFPTQQIAIANLLPPFISVLTLLLAHWLLRQTFPADPKYVLVGTFGYAFLANAFANQIEAGGLAESFGSLALLVYFISLFHYRKQPGNVKAALTGLALGLCVLSSPGSAIAASLLLALLMFEAFSIRKEKARVLVQMGIAAVTGLVLSAPYLLTVMFHHGRGFFILPVLAQYQNAGKLPYSLALFNRLTSFNIADGAGIFFWNTFIFLGLFALFFRGKLAVPLAFLAIFSIPRENFWLMAFPATLLFTHGLVDVLLPLVQPTLAFSSVIKKVALALGLALLACWLAAQSFALSDALVADGQWKLPAAQVQGIKAAKDVIPPGENVLVLANDAVLEWTPYLLEREVLNTKFGLEWQPAELESITLLNNKIASAQSWDDILQALTQMNGQTRIYILSTDKRKLTALTRNSHVSFTLKRETPEVQVGILSKP